jgi:hypothetical protein
MCRHSQSQKQRGRGYCQPIHHHPLMEEKLGVWVAFLSLKDASMSFRWWHDLHNIYIFIVGNRKRERLLQNILIIIIIIINKQ